MMLERKIKCCEPKLYLFPSSFDLNEASFIAFSVFFLAVKKKTMTFHMVHTPGNFSGLYLYFTLFNNLTFNVSLQNMNMNIITSYSVFDIMYRFNVKYRVKV